MGGFPNRPDLATFGPDVINTGIIKDPSRQLSAETFNLLKFQVAGLGLTGFRAMLAFLCTGPTSPLARVEAWNPRGLTSDPFGDPTITRIGTGEYDVEYPTPVLDQAGSDAALSFAYGVGMIIEPSQTVLTHVMVSPLLGNAAGVKVAIFDGTLAPIDGYRIAILIG